MTIKKLISAMILATAPVVGGCDLSIDRKVNPIGWHDFNKDGVEDAIILAPARDEPDKYLEMKVIDGTSIHGYYGTIREGFVDHDLKTRSRGNYLAGAHAFTKREGVTMTAVCKDAERGIELHLYTNVDVEPGAKHEVFRYVAPDYINH